MIRTTLILLLSLFISTTSMAHGKCCKQETKSCCKKTERTCCEKKSSCASKCEKQTSCASKCEKKTSSCCERKVCGGWVNPAAAHATCCADLSMDNECVMDGKFCHEFHELEDCPWLN